MSVRKLIRLKAIWGALALLVVIVAIAVPAAVGQRGGGIATAPPEERLFSHARHEKTVKLECKRCHNATADGEWKEQGKKEHARCFTCHKFSSSCGVLKKKEGRVCLSCHVTFKSSCTPSDYVTPEAGKAEFSASYSHRLHVRPTANSGEQCEQCHGEFGNDSPDTGTLAAGHALCSGCHARGVTPRIKESCDGCHKRGPAQSIVSNAGKNPYSVQGAFNHRKHAGMDRVGTEGRDCLACHENIKSSKADNIVPLPTMQGCQSTCHDGKKAFNAVGATCTRCHTKGGGE